MAKKRGRRDAPTQSKPEEKAQAADAGGSAVSGVSEGPVAGEPAGGGGDAVAPLSAAAGAVGADDDLEDGKDGLLTEGKADETQDMDDLENPAAPGLAHPDGADGETRDAAAGAATDAGLDQGERLAAAGAAPPAGGDPAALGWPLDAQRADGFEDLIAALTDADLTGLPVPPRADAGQADRNSFVRAQQEAYIAFSSVCAMTPFPLTWTGQYDASKIAAAFLLANRDAPIAALPIHLARAGVGGAMKPDKTELLLWGVFRDVFLRVYDYLEAERLAALPPEPPQQGGWPGRQAFRVRDEPMSGGGFDPEP